MAKPVPKSSMARRTPSSLNRRELLARSASGSVMRSASVTSRHSRSGSHLVGGPGSRPRSRPGRRRRAGGPTGWRPPRASGQRAAAATACSITQRPSGRIRPVSVATGTKALGCTSPTPGPLPAQQGLDAHHGAGRGGGRPAGSAACISSARRASRSAFSTSRRATAWSRRPTWNSAMRLRPRCLASYMARSASCSTSAGSAGARGVDHADARRHHDPAAREVDGLGQRRR